MAVLTTKGKLPEGAVALSESQAGDLQWSYINSWPNWTEVWPFKLGVVVLVGLGGVTSIRINNVFRSKLKMKELSKGISHYTVGFGSMVLSAFGHQLWVTRKLMIFQNVCPVCIESRAILLQLGSCVIYSSVLSALTNCVLANRYATYRVPYWSDGKGLIKLYFQLVLSLRNRIEVYVALNAIAAGYITYSEGKSLRLIQRTLLERAHQQNLALMESIQTEELEKL